jgi:hypothetical protein
VWLTADGPECYLTTANPVDIVLNYENTYAAYLTWTGPSAWTNNYNASRCGISCRHLLEGRA